MEAAWGLFEKKNLYIRMLYIENLLDSCPYQIWQGEHKEHREHCWLNVY